MTSPRYSRFQGNDLTLVARQDWRRGLGARETRQFQFIFQEVRQTFCLRLRLLGRVL